MRSQMGKWGQIFILDISPEHSESESFFSPCRSMDVLKNINRLKFSPRLSPGQTVPDLLWLLRSNSLLSIKHQEKYHRGTSRRLKNPEQAGAPNDSTYF
jgi:hypothetical protein